MKIPIGWNTIQSISYGVGLRATAAIATAAYADPGLVTETDHTFIVDHKKIKRAQEKVIDLLKQKPVNNAAINCIFYDGRLDIIKVVMNAKNPDRQFLA